MAQCLNDNTVSGQAEALAYPGWQLALKRLIDLIAALVLLVLTSPLWLYLAVRIRLDSPGPALFRQIRIGRDGRPYTIFKFRTMVQDAEAIFKPAPRPDEDLENFVYQSEDDPRITRVGKLLRKTSLDELPQLLNVLNGEMSLVGPRPEVPEIVKLYTPEQWQRLRVLPGITGLAQISGRSELTFGETMAYDLEYVRNWSLGLDLKILWRTVFVVFAGKGAY